MLISYNWLKKYVKISDSTLVADVAHKLMMSTVEVENIERLGANLENIVVGKVLKAEKHPGADRLKVCEVDVGNERLPIVCGGSNVYADMLVAVAKVGTKVKWHGEGDLIELVPTTIRGVESLGMICASTEIGLGEIFPTKDEKEILDLSNQKIKVGTPLSEALKLNDAILEIDNKSLSNRPDLWGHYGIAREVAVLFNRELISFTNKKIKSGKELKITAQVENEKLCQRYMAVAINGVIVAESPEWLKKSLMSVGLRPINNIVDVTNYVMYDLGQPMHAFDAAVLSDKNEALDDKTIIVRSAKDGEEFTTLDGTKHKLGLGTLVIATDKKPVALAGIMGGIDSGINENTTTIVLESANFDAATIRKTSTKIGLRTDSSARFEKSLDPHLCNQALEKAAELILELCPGAKVVSNVADEKHIKMFRGPLDIKVAEFSKKLGVEIPEKTIIDILVKLGFEVKLEKESLRIKIPTWRATKDISIAEDLIEEVARIYGYDNIPAVLPVFPIAPGVSNKERLLERKIKDAVSKILGYTEVYNYSFVSSNSIAAMGDNLESYIELDYPLSKEKPYVRRHLLNNVLENIQKNLENYPELRIMEIGKTFIAEEAGPRVEAAGNELLPRQDTWGLFAFTAKKEKNAFAEVKRAADVIVHELNLELLLQPVQNILPWFHPTKCGEMILEEKKLGNVYEINPNVLDKFNIESAVGIVEINLTELSNIALIDKKFMPISIFPKVVRDVTLVVNKDVEHQQIVTALNQFDGLLAGVELTDIYTGTNVAENKKSMTYRLTFLNKEKTLTTEEVEAALKKIITLLKDKFEAEIRQ